MEKRRRRKIHTTRDRSVCHVCCMLLALFSLASARRYILLRYSDLFCHDSLSLSVSFPLLLAFSVYILLPRVSLLIFSVRLTLLIVSPNRRLFHSHGTMKKPYTTV